MTADTETKIDGRTAEAKAAKAAIPTAKRRRRASVGGFTMKLDAEPRSGFVRRWVNGDPSRLHEAAQLGYDFVTDRAGEGASRTDGPGSRISRHAGKDPNGAGMQTFLMECTQEDYDRGVAEKEAQRKPFDEAINSGADPTGGLTKADMYDAGRSTINNSG